MKNLVFVVIIIFSSLLTGCNRDTKANEFLKTFDSTTTRMAEKFDEGDIDGARQVFEKEKDSIRSEWLFVRGIYSFQLSDGTMKKMQSVPPKNMEKLTQAANRAIEKNPASHDKIQKLVDDLAFLVRR